jgi:hypothetical protein
MFTAVPLFSERVVVLALEIAVLHLLIRLVTFTDPSPVAWSYPTVALNPVAPGMFVFPTVTSLKTQVEIFGGFAGGTFDALQEESVSLAASL